jgi:hypothetical protein
LTGNATAHGSVNNISNLTVTLNDNAFASNASSGVTGATKNGLQITFLDAKALSYSSTVLTEATANDGLIANPLTLTLVGDKFATPLVGVTVTNEPSGLTGVITRVDDTTATLTLTGKAKAHDNAQDISNLMVTFANNSFVGGNALSVAGATNNAIKVDFSDVGGFIEGTINGDILKGSANNDIIYGKGGADTINGDNGNDTVNITDAGTSSAIVIIGNKSHGTDTVIGFKGGAINSGGDQLDVSSLVVGGLTGIFSTGLKLNSDFIKGNVFIFNSTSISINEAAAAIAADIDVVATNGYIVIANSQNNDAVTLYYADNLDNNGNETPLVILSGLDINTLTATNFIV